MKKHITSLLFLLIILNYHSTYSQNLTYHSDIRAIKFAQENWNLGYPIFSEKVPLQLDFDFLGEEQQYLAYRVIHCNADWLPSNISAINYLKNSKNEFYIDNYELSSSTRTLYTHYQIQIPSQDVQLKFSGNYKLQVFKESNPEEILFEQGFMYSENLVNIEGKIVRAIDINNGKTHQRLQFDVKYDKNAFHSPRTNIKAVVSQNFRWDKGSSQLLTPLFIQSNLLRFNYINKQSRFRGNYEFPYFDTSDLVNESYTVKAFDTDKDYIRHSYLYPQKSASRNYFYVKDMNGNFVIKSENTFQTATESDYTWVHFALISEELPTDVFVVGRFNQWQLSSENLMSYDTKLGIYHTAILLKQGVYNYTFVTEDTDSTLVNLLGNFSQTENDYYVFIYYKDERLQADRLIGWQKFNSQTDGEF